MADLDSIKKFVKIKNGISSLERNKNDVLLTVNGEDEHEDNYYRSILVNAEDMAYLLLKACTDCDVTTISIRKLVAQCGGSNKKFPYLQEDMLSLDKQLPRIKRLKQRNPEDFSGKQLDLISSYYRLICRMWRYLKESLSPEEREVLYSE